MKYLYAESPVLTAESFPELRAMNLAVEQQYPVTQYTDSHVRSEDIRESVVPPALEHLKRAITDNKAITWNLDREISIEFTGEEASLIFASMNHYSRQGEDLTHRTAVQDVLKAMEVTVDPALFATQSLHSARTQKRD